MEIVIKGTSEEVKELLQAIASSKEQSVVISQSEDFEELYKLPQ